MNAGSLRSKVTLRTIYMKCILIVEDEQHLAEGLRFNFEAEGYRVDISGDGLDALDILKNSPFKYDAIILDVMLPGKDGFEVMSELRRLGLYIPVLMLTARNRPEDVLKGFEAGADDYVAKPFELAILIARLKGLFRRHDWLKHTSSESDKNSGDKNSGKFSAETENEVLTIGDKTIDLSNLELRSGDQTIRLTSMEADLLRYLISNEGQVVSRRKMLEEVWGLHEDTDTRAIDNFIVRLRKYIEDNPANPHYLITVRGIGYKLTRGN